MSVGKVVMTLITAAGLAIVVAPVVSASPLTVTVGGNAAANCNITTPGKAAPGAASVLLATSRATR